MAVMAWAEFIVVLHVPMPEQKADCQPANAKPVAGVAAKVTVVPPLYCAVHVAPQLIFPSLVATFPALEPTPPKATESAYCGGGAGPKAAVTPMFELMLTTQEPVPEHAPLQPVNTDPDAGVAAKATTEPEL